MQSPQFPLLNSPTLNPISSNNPFPVKIRPPNLILNLNLHRSHSPKPTITCARSSSNKRLFKSPHSQKTLIRLARFAASNLHYVLPAPLNSVVRELGAGDGIGGGGGGSRGFWNLGWGGFDGGGGGGKRRINRKSKLGFWWVVTVCCVAIWGLILAGELELKKDVVILGALCLSMFLVLIRNGWVSEWILGFCSGGVLVGVLLQKKDELQKLVKGVKAIGVSRRGRGRRGLWR